MFTRRMVVLLAAALGLVAASGCSRSPVGTSESVIQNPTFERAHPPGFSSTATAPITGSQTIDGAVGGSLSVGSFRVDVPAGAFQGSATISITQNDPNVLVCDIGISPASANGFAVPVTIVSELPSSTAVNDQWLWYDASVNGWRPISSQPNSATLELSSQLWHFSLYGIERAGW
jgi:hypothetical protein